MEGLSKLVDSLVQAPLWIFVAIALASGACLFNPPFLTDAGVTSSTKIVGVPVAAIFVTTASMALASAVARLLPALAAPALRLIKRAAFEREIGRLSENARGVLRAMDELGVSDFYYATLRDEIAELQDMDILGVRLTGTGWAHYYLKHRFESAWREHRADARRLTKVGPETQKLVATGWAEGSRAASRLV